MQNALAGLKPFSAMLAYSCNAKFSQNLTKQNFTGHALGPTDFGKSVIYSPKK